MKSSSEESRGGLAPRVSAAQAKEFLVELANLPWKPTRIEVFERRFGQVFFQEVPWDLVRHWAVNILEDQDMPSDTELLREFWLKPLRDTLRATWEASDVAVKEWGVFKIRERFLLWGERGLVKAPMQDESNWFLGALGQPGQCDQIFLYLLKVARLARRCANPDCNFLPYFFAARPTQKYCCETCALPAQREAKRRWWKAHGSRRRRRASLMKRARRRR